MSPRAIAVSLCGGLCIAFAALAWTACSGKSATWDEPSHAAAGWLMLWQHDYRLSPDVPPLWEYWIALPNGPDALHFDAASPSYRKFNAKSDFFRWCVQTLYRTPGNDGIALVERGRVMALILGVLLAILIARWAWQLGGPAAAVAATFLYCLDPNFIGHAPLVKNDVAFTLFYLAGAYAIWRLGRRVSLMSLSAVALLIAAAVAVKLSGVLLFPVLLIALTLRAVMAEPWPIFGREVTCRVKKFAFAVATFLLAAIVTYAGLWASYGFRFDAGPDGMRSDTPYFVRALRQGQLLAENDRLPTQADLAGWKKPLSTRAVLFCENHHLLPQAWTAGYILTQMGDQDRGAFLLNEDYSGGRWYYFPLAAVFKAPLATIAAVLLAGLIGFSTLKRGLLRPSANRWTLMAMLVPVLVYGAIILSANLNIGLRHAFPIYPFVFIAVSLAAARVWAIRPAKAGAATGGQVTILVLAAALAAETAAAFPNYIAFFNIACASHRIDLLADSNLDWGQDLPLLAEWQSENPNTVLYLDYFGLCDPAAYGIRYVNVPQGYLFGHTPVMPTKPGVVALSATFLQQPYGPDPMVFLFNEHRPFAILGDTIYLFKFDAADFLPPATRP
jgi:hypothetical protein